MVERITTDLLGGVVKGRKGTTERVFLVVSLTPEKASPARVLGLNRAQWGIENRLHHVRDMTFDEDRSQVRRGNRPHAMASLRNAAISLFRLVGVTNVAAATRELGRKPEAVARLMGL